MENQIKENHQIVPFSYLTIYAIVFICFYIFLFSFVFTLGAYFFYFDFYLFFYLDPSIQAIEENGKNMPLCFHFHLGWRNFQNLHKKSLLHFWQTLYQWTKWLKFYGFRNTKRMLRRELCHFRSRWESARQFGEYYSAFGKLVGNMVE